MYGERRWEDRPPLPKDPMTLKTTLSLAAAVTLLAARRSLRLHRHP